MTQSFSLLRRMTALDAIGPYEILSRILGVDVKRVSAISGGNSYLFRTGFKNRIWAIWVEGLKARLLERLHPNFVR